MKDAKRVLLVTRNFPPLVGGMERLTYHAYRELRKTFKVDLVGPAGSERHVAVGGCVATCPLTPLPAFLVCLPWQACQLARRWQPDLVFAGSGLAAPAALLAARIYGARAVCYLHGLDLATPHLVYRAIFMPAIRRCDLLLVNSRNTAILARQHGIPEAKLALLHPGVELLGIVPDDVSFRDRIGASDHPLLLSVGRLQARKGLVEFAERVLPRLVAQHPNLLWVIIGGEPENALAASHGVADRLLAAAASAGVRDHVLMLGRVEDHVLRAAYRESDLLVFPVLHLPGDVEGFGMVAVEAAAHGLPTVAFAAGGVPDAVREGLSGYLVSPGDYAGFTETVLRHLGEADRSAWRVRCTEFARNFSWDLFGERLRSLCGEVIAAPRS